ncbi:hypothetical protein P3T36_000743 [Kitasatospora sp. MAP12-15]|uniref:hypothetical protein n=1 Tax=unclassified Kitasatospora TaxID=2633591 RepID=UPI002475BC27|nr:hypothetical protein [Kitasatospora sp. MAP12-44]MDH6114342.1 hypothetical protein [Kitasatospora sp. MAP12-44]
MHVDQDDRADRVAQQFVPTPPQPGAGRGPEQQDGGALQGDPADSQGHGRVRIRRVDDHAATSQNYAVHSAVTFFEHGLANRERT